MPSNDLIEQYESLRNKAEEQKQKKQQLITRIAVMQERFKELGTSAETAAEALRKLGIEMKKLNDKYTLKEADFRKKYAKFLQKNNQ